MQGGLRWLISVLLLMVSTLPARAVLSITLEEKAVTLSGVTPGQSAVLMGVDRRPIEFGVAVSRRFETLTDTDADGVVRFDMPEGVSLGSAWWGADLTSGELVSGGGDPNGLVLMATEDRSISSAPAPGELLLGVLHHPRLELALVRPSVGAFYSSLAEGGGGDEDGLPDGVISLSLLSLAPTTSGQSSLTDIQTNDVLFGIDPHTLEVFSLKPVLEVGNLTAAIGGAR